MIEEYFLKVQQGLTTILKQESTHIEAAASLLTNTIKNDGIIHIFGCGHSHMIAEESFYRAGGLVPINPIFEESLMLHEDAVYASKLERDPLFGKEILAKHEISPIDTIIVVSTSGRNPVPIDVALTAKEKGCAVIVITSFFYRNLSSRHLSGKHLSDVADIAINNHVDIGDAVLSHKSVEVPFIPVSSIHSLTITNAMFAETIKCLADAGINTPIFMSGNVDHSETYNQKIIERFQGKVQALSARNPQRKKYSK
ncbi:SIS domain-containing protein [Bacillus alkalicellulosilyticus]|uniref:SIS domain-containing protein n=1 Tax=Alkalihalobacterium alkalicellulosilyticum TaxID=1912214 RepID=UPI0009969920|nr:SIS domain-containing protein [Bacillus alkalicellulosilyticus]